MGILTTAVRNIVRIYDATTLPVYYLVQQPWKTLRESRKLRAVQLKPGDPYSPWIRKGPQYDFLKSDQTLAKLLKMPFTLFPDNQCLGFRKVLGEEIQLLEDAKMGVRKQLAPNYTWYTYAEVDQKVDNLMKGFIEMGIKPKDIVVIFMETRMEWILTFLALNRMGAVVATLISTLGPQGLVYGINIVESTTLVTNATLLPTVQSIAPQLTYLKNIVYFEGTSNQYKTHMETLAKSFNLITLSSVERKGQETLVNGGMKCIEPNKTAVIMFTSGSTGIPKGVLLDSNAILEGVKAVRDILADASGIQIYTAYLPLAHIMELVSELVHLSRGDSIGYASPFTLFDNSVGLMPRTRGDVPILKPTIMPAVPLTMERLKKAIKLKNKLEGSILTGHFEQLVDYKQKWTAKGYKTPMLDRFVFRKYKDYVGGKLKRVYCGGAPVSPETQKFLETVLCAKVLQGYGSTETVFANSVANYSSFCYGTAGPPVGNFRIKLVPWPEGGYYPTDKPNARGEIHVGSRAIAKGYFKNETHSREAFYEEGGLRWFRTGDIGEISPDGLLKIIDRAKDIVKLMNGEFVSLGKIESALRDNEYVENICVYANPNTDFVIALISPNVQRLTKLLNIKGQENNFSKLCNDHQIVGLVLDSIKSTAMNAKLSKCETPQKLIICPEEWSPASGLVTGAMKIRRKQIYDFYASKIKDSYASM